MTHHLHNKQPDGIPYRVDTDSGPRGTQQGYNVSNHSVCLPFLPLQAAVLERACGMPRTSMVS